MSHRDQQIVRYNHDVEDALGTGESHAHVRERTAHRAEPVFHQHPPRRTDSPHVADRHQPYTANRHHEDEQFG